MASKQAISDVLDEMGLVYDRDVATATKRIYWADLADLSDEDLATAARLHRRDPVRGQFWPKPGDLLGALGRSGPQHPGADAAWAIALQAMDQDRSVVLTDEIAAATELARVVFEGRDKVGARLAFRAAYEGILARISTAPRWRLSVGHDAAQRAEAVEGALAQGLITREQARHLLPVLPSPDDGAAVAGLLGRSNVVPITRRPEGADAAVGMRRAVGVMRAAMARGEREPEARVIGDEDEQARYAAALAQAAGVGAMSPAVGGGVAG